MNNQSRKWMVLAATIWIQAFTGTNFDFSAYSCALKFALGLSQVQLNYLATASDFGKALGWCCGLALQSLPVWVIMFISAFMGLIGYGLQWLVILKVITLPYFVVFLLCLMAGCSICWFNTVCFVLCSRNFPASRPFALALSVSFNGLSAALYNLMADAFNPSARDFYLVLNAFVPILISLVALFPILCQSPEDPVSVDSVNRDKPIFIGLNILAVFTGLYLLFLHSTNSLTSYTILFGAICLLIMYFGIPAVFTSVYSMFNGKRSGFFLPDAEDIDLQQALLKRRHVSSDSAHARKNGDRSPYGCLEEDSRTCQRSCNSILGKDRLFSICEEHKAHDLVRRLDFWLYYAAYCCGGTIGLVYSNNLGQISEALGLNSMTTTLITLYSSFSFFGRLLSAGPDFIKNKVCFPRTGWMAIMLLPTPFAFFLLASSSSGMALKVGTSLIGLSSGFLFAGAVSITSELFGPNSIGVNHNILITNIPIGSLVYGFLAATIYDEHGSPGIVSTSNPIVCIGRECYFTTFIWWGCIAILGVASSFVLFFRTRHAYHQYEQNQM